MHEWLASRIDDLPAADATRPRPAVIVQDPCHLRHVQKAHLPVRTVLGRYADVVELDDDGLCCGAGGAYSALQPELAGDIRDRKVAAIEPRRRISGGRRWWPAPTPDARCTSPPPASTVTHPLDIVDDLIP